MPLATRPLATAPLAGAVLNARVQPAGALVLRQTVASMQPVGELVLKQVVAQPQEAGALELRQQVIQVQAAGALALRQQVVRIQPAGQLQLLQRVVDPTGTGPTQGAKIPGCYVLINGVSFTESVSIHGVTISQSEGENSTAQFFAYFEEGVEIFVPSFNGKPVQLLAHQDHEDITSPVIPFFTGTIIKSQHVPERCGIQFSASDMRDERLGRENPDELKALTGGVYSSITQQEDAEGIDYVRELMKTVIGSVGYSRAGDLRYYRWGTEGKSIDWVFTGDDVHYKEMSTDFKTRNDIKNTVTIKMQYRWNRLNRFKTTINTKRPRIIKNGDGTYDLQTFSKDSMVDRANGFAPWETLSYSIIPANAVVTANAFSGDPNKPTVAETSSALRGRAVGFEATIQRRVAQPVTELYSVKLVAPQSVDAYGEEVKGSTLSFAIDHEYDRSTWEEHGYHYGADTKREVLAKAWEAGLLIGFKELVSEHRENTREFLIRDRLMPVEVGHVVSEVTPSVTVTAQIQAVTWRIDDGVRDTQIRLAVSYMDTQLSPPALDLTPPERPAVSGQYLQSLTGTSSYIGGRLEASAPEIPDAYTNEKKVDVPEMVIEVPLENNQITLINGR